jgi:protein SCO1/2
MRISKPSAQSGKTPIIVPVLLLIVIAAGFALRTMIMPAPLPDHATVLPAPASLAEFSLTTHDDQPFTRDSFRGHWSMVFFGFTNCPDICPITLHQLVTARKRLSESDPGSALPDIVFISVDPDRDSAESLKKYVQSFGEGLTGVRGEPAELSTLTKPLGIYFNVDNADEQDYKVEHSAAVIVVNENAEFHALFSAPHNIDAFANDMRLIIASK